MALADASRFTREPNLDRSGGDIRKDILHAEASVEDCEARCLATKGCLAFTFVRKSTTVPEPICWIKHTASVGYPSNCCTSGVLKQ
jgi:hypothetical protein